MNREEEMSQPLKLLRSDDSLTEGADRASEIALLFEKARRGELPRRRELLPHEPQLLNERHCQAIMMRVMGMRQKDIAQSLGYTDSTVSIVLNHPDAQFVIDSLQGFSGVGVTDIDARLKRLTPKAVDAIEAVFDDEIEDDPKAVSARVQRARLGFSLLEHTGNGPKREVEHTHSHRLSLDKGAASLISRALRESSQIVEAEYTIETPGDGVEGVEAPKMLPLGTEAPPLGGSQES